MYRSQGSVHMSATVNLTEQHDNDDPYEVLLWAIVGQAVEDATRTRGDTDCTWTAAEAMSFLERMFGPTHKILRGVNGYRERGQTLKVNLHEQDNSAYGTVKGAGAPEVVRTCVKCGGPLTRGARSLCGQCYEARGDLAHITVKCAACGKSLRRKAHQLHKTKHSFCDRKCQSEWRRGGVK